MNEQNPSAFATRDYRPGDMESLREIYRAAVLETAHCAYDDAQTKAWARYADDPAFDALVADAWVRVAYDDRGPVGFGAVQAPDHIALLYTAPRAARQGVAKLILDDLVELAQAMGAQHVSVNASRVSRMFFLKHGFAETDVEEIERDGISFERFKMKARL